VDAAPFMPASIFANTLTAKIAKQAYIEATEKLYKVPFQTGSAANVKQGRCKDLGFIQPGGAIQGISWYGGMMGRVCSLRCGCNFGNSAVKGLPFCKKNYKNDPAHGHFCSLCGTESGCPGCLQGTTSVQFWNVASGTNIFHNPKHGGVAPVASKTKHLYFHTTTSSRGMTVNGKYVADTECINTDAAPFMPASIFENTPTAKIALAAYIEVTLKGYHSTGGVQLSVGSCRSKGYTKLTGEQRNIPWAPASLMVPVCRERCGCTFSCPTCPAGSKSHPACTAVKDFPDKGQFCSLCKPDQTGKQGNTMTGTTWKNPNSQYAKAMAAYRKRTYGTL